MVYIILGKGFEEVEALAPCDILRRGGVEVRLAGIDSNEVESGHGVTVKADCLVDDVIIEKGDIVVFPGGLGGVATIRKSEKALSLMTEAYNAGNYVAAICAGPTILGDLGILKGKKAVCYPGMEDGMIGAEKCPGVNVVVDGTVITGRAAGAAYDFGLKLLEIVKDRETAEKVKNSIYY